MLPFGAETIVAYETDTLLFGFSWTPSSNQAAILHKWVVTIQSDLVFE
jgi:hypothetical protein